MEIDINGLRKVIADCYWPTSPVAINEILNRLEAAERDVALKERVIDALGSELNAVAKERDALRAENERMEKMQAALRRHHETRRDSDVVTDAVKHVWGKVAVGSMAAYSIPLYALPGAQNIPEKLCYDSRWEISIDYVDGWNAAVDMMRGKSPSWHCPDCCIVFPFGEPKACPNDDPRCNRLLAAAPETEGE